jgi:flavin reductase (DIM6/NTAB) family NADH-FMN oxidoreductase RutF
MFWETDQPHGLPHNPFKSCVVPRPIGWISSLSANGTLNLAPFSFFNAVSSEPPMVMFGANGNTKDRTKDSLSNVEETGEFVCNMATWELRDQMNTSSASVGAEVNEFELAGLETEPAKLVKPPRVKSAPIHLECVLFKVVDMPSDNPGVRHGMVIGQVVGVHIKDEVLKDGLVDIERIMPLARMGYKDYTHVEKVYPMERPKS